MSMSSSIPIKIKILPINELPEASPKRKPNPSSKKSTEESQAKKTKVNNKELSSEVAAFNSSVLFSPVRSNSSSPVRTDPPPHHHHPPPPPSSPVITAINTPMPSSNFNSNNKLTTSIRDSGANFKARIKNIIKERHTMKNKLLLDVEEQKKSIGELHTEYMDNVTKILNNQTNRIRRWSPLLKEVKNIITSKEEKNKPIETKYNELVNNILPVINESLKLIDQMKLKRNNDSKELDRIKESMNNFVNNTLEETYRIVEMNNELNTRIAAASSITPSQQHPSQQTRGRKKKQQQNKQDNNSPSSSGNANNDSGNSNEAVSESNLPDEGTSNSAFRPLTANDKLEASLFKLYKYGFDTNPKMIFKRKRKKK